MSVENEYKTVLELFENKEYVTICAPMVRYSKLPFRMLVRKYGCDVAFTPMMVSHSFLESTQARDSDFTTCPGDRPLIAQFAAKNSTEFADVAELIYRNSDGIDLNCGCPQRWAMSDGFGACLLDKPEVVHDMIHQVKNRIPDSNYTVSLKIRLHSNVRETVEFCQRAERAGASWISVHGRTKTQRNEAVDVNAIKLIKENVSIPVVANGDVFHLNDAAETQKLTGVNGIMCARGILQNPTLFMGTDMTPPQCVSDWINVALSYGTSFTSFHHHLIFMLEKIMPKAERKLFNSYSSYAAVIDHLEIYNLQS